MPKYQIKVVSKLVGCFLFVLFATKAHSQENEWNTWTSLELSKDITRNFSVYISPEVRFTDEFTLDEYFMEAGLEYELLKFLEIGGNYRFLVNERETKSSEYYHRIAFDLKGKFEINRFDFQVRTRYTNYSDLDADDDTNDNYFRYRLKVAYDIPKSKITPHVGVELFHQLEDQEINRIRYLAGVEYKFNKHHRMELGYLLQDYLKKSYHKNVVSLEYKIDF